MILADATPSWQSTLSVAAMFGSGLGVIISIGVLYYMKRQSDTMRQQTDLMAQQANRPNTISPQPLTVSITEELHKTFAAKEEFEQHVRLNREEIEGLRLERKNDNNLLHEKINKVDREVGGLVASTSVQNQTLAQMDAKITRLLERKA
jgi:hypothetical protein